MPVTAQSYVSAATAKAANDLITAIEALPVEKREWKPLDKGRSALDQAAECAILNGSVANLLKTRVFPSNFDMEEFGRNKAELARDWEKLKALLQANTEVVTAAIEAVPDEDLSTEIELPWGKRTVQEIMGYPHWNMSYHEGQTNYIATISE